VEEQYGAIKPTTLRLKLKGIETFMTKKSLPIETVIEMTEQVPVTKKVENSIVVEETIEVLAERYRKYKPENLKTTEK
jgi:hypothetical protein